MTAPVLPSRRALVARRFWRRRAGVVALAVLLALGLASVAVPPLLPFDHTDLDFTALAQPPSAQHPLGTNGLGQDLLAQTLRGLQKSLVIGLAVAMIAATLAAVVGTVAGYFGGWRDAALMWVVDLLLVVPSFVLIAVVTPRTTDSGSVVALVVLLAAFSWMVSSRVVRGMTVTLRDREYVRAARYMGVPGRQVIARHILPNVASLLIVDTALTVGVAILAETGLSFLGFGVQPPDVSLGTLIAAGTGAATVFPWVFLVPALTLVTILVCANVIGDALRDALDPTATATGRRRR